MEECKFTKADIDKVRQIEGFPIANDEDIIALSRPPYYTACPNPFVEKFIQENGVPYNEETDDYHREPFAADVSEGKNDPIYNAHSYHTKVPHKAIMRYILHYTKPGDIVFDGFCGTGMTGVAAQACSSPEPSFKAEIENEMVNVQWGSRKAIISDLSPAATFISQNYTTPVNVELFEAEATRILSACKDKYGWMYETDHVLDNGDPVIGIDGEPVKGIVNYTIWSDVFICPSCSKEVDFWETAVSEDQEEVKEVFICPNCGSNLSKRDCTRAQETYYDTFLKKECIRSKQKLERVNYSVGKKRYEKVPSQSDMDVLKKIEQQEVEYWGPTDELPDGSNTDQPKRSHGVYYVNQFYLLSAYHEMSMYWHEADKVADKRISSLLKFALTAAASYISRMRRFRSGKKGGGPLPGTLYIASIITPLNPLITIARNAKNIAEGMRATSNNLGSCLITTQSAGDLSNIPTNSIDYIFTDPPFGGNINYSELNFLWEAWLQIVTNNQEEAIVNSTQKKTVYEYQEIMEKCLREYYRILKPNHWITVEFHNSQNSIWNSITEALLKAGFVIADVRVLDKKQGSFKQVTTTSAVKQDLVITAYKPRESFVYEFQQHAGDPEMAWEFVRQHLRNVPITADGNHDGKLDIIAERQDYLLFDRMVAWHIMNGIPVPMDAHTFYEGLRQRFLERDGMFFLPDQVNEYDDKRAHMELDTAQLSFIVTDEKNAIQWLNFILAESPKPYSEIQPLYMQELHQSRQEKMPELLDMLKENFVQDEKGSWYVPDLTNAADLAKVRRKALLKEFWDSCATGRGKLKVFRMEAIRAGFDECWKTRDFKTIVSVGERLPEAVLQEDSALLMYYDNACSRV